MSVAKAPFWALLGAFALAFAACAPQENPSSGGLPVTLIPYRSPTPAAPQPTSTPRPPDPLAPSGPSPTPFVYTVRQGDTLSGIASRFGIALDQLQAANPAVDPRFLSVGATLIIPLGGENPAAALPSPTPAALQLGFPNCLAAADGGLTCFLLASNLGEIGLENVAARLTLLDGDRAALASETALPPLNLLPAGESLPLAAVFPPPVPAWAAIEVQLLSALPATDGSGRYLALEISDSQIEVAPDGLSAVISGTLALAPGSKPAGQVWVAAVALDSAGRVVGIRRWENNTPLAAGDSLEFTLYIYSLSGPIADLQLFAEARP